MENFIHIKTNISKCILTFVFAIVYINSFAMPVAPEPTIQTISFIATAGSCSEIDLSFIPGDGNRRIVIACENGPVTKLPQDGTGYSAGSIFGTGADLGSNNYVVYNAGGTSTTITGLTGGTEYFFAIFESNGSGNNSNYLQPGYLESNVIAPGLSMSISSSSGELCKGDSVQLEVHGAETYQWFPSSSLSSETDSIVWAKPITTTQYSVVGTESGSGCTQTKVIAITVYSKPNVVLGNFSNQCLNGSNVTLNSGSPVGGTYSGDGVTGLSFNPSVAGVGQHIIKYSYSDIHGCAASDTSSILVFSSPTVTLSAFVDACINTPAFLLSGGSPAGGTYFGTGVSANQFDPAVAGIGHHSIRYEYTDLAGCSDDKTKDQEVRALPAVSFSTLQPVCLNVPSFTLTGGTPAPGEYSGTGVSNSQFSPLVSSAGSFVLTYTYTDSHSCTAKDTSVMTVHTLPSVGFAPITPVCQNFGPVTLSGGTPTPGVYSGAFVSNGKFYSGIAGAGQHTITYTYTNNFNCSNLTTQTITINEVPRPDLGVDFNVCSDESANLTPGEFATYAWSTGAHSPTIKVDTTGRGLGIFPFSVIVTNSFGCANKDTILITFDPCSDINILNPELANTAVFPNPFSSQCTIATEEGSTVSVYNMTGAFIMEKKNTPSFFTFGETLAAGTYLIRVQKNQKNVYRLILKN